MMSGKKRLLIVNNNLASGGVQRSLVNLLHEIKDDYEITLFLFYNNGDYKDLIPEGVNVMEASLPLKLLGASQSQSRQMGLLYCFLRGILALFTKLFGNHIPIYLLTLAHKKLSGFDKAISYHHCAEEHVFYSGCNEFVLNRVDAGEKIAFLHCDFSNYGGNTKKNRRKLARFNKIAAVSEGCRSSFIRAVSELAARTYCVYNCSNYPYIIRCSEDDPIVYSHEFLNIVTVARLSFEKGILRGIRVVEKLLRLGYKIKWHIIGNGPLKAKIETEVIKSNLTEYIILYGNQKNPFRYIKNADLLLLTSYHEAAPMVIDEAKCLKVPVLTTETISAKEMIKSGREGFICENSDEGIYEMLKSILDNPQMLYECKKNLFKEQFSNEKSLLQFHKLINEEI